MPFGRGGGGLGGGQGFPGFGGGGGGGGGQPGGRGPQSALDPPRGPDFFVDRVMDDPRLNVLYDPQQPVNDTQQLTTYNSSDQGQDGPDRSETRPISFEETQSSAGRR